jgi:two-component system, NtrC family, sensor kinase
MKSQKGDGDGGGDDEKLDDQTVVRVSVAKRQWERTFDAISESLMILDEDYVIRRANLALADELGTAIQRVVGRRCFDVRAESPQALTGTPGQPCDGCPVADAQQARAAKDGEVRSKSGRTMILRAFPLLDEEVPLTVCSYHDVTEEREMTRQLGSAEKLAAIGRLAGGVAHEINNPLGGILAFAQILQREDVTPEERRDYLGEIERSALRCKAIVESLLRFSRQAPQTKRRVLSLNDVVRDAVRLTGQKTSARTDVRLRVTLADDPPSVLGDANQLLQVVVNLIGNAFDSVVGAGEIEVVTSEREGDVVLRIADSGSGIANEHMASLFDPFFTTKEEGKGAGLGLAVSYAIVQEHGGRITAHNRATGGAEFLVTLPQQPAAAGET